MTTILEGIDENTGRPEMLDRLRSAAKTILDLQDKKVGRLQEIDERVRRKWTGSREELIQIIATATTAEWTTAVDFLEDFENLLPTALVRIHDGAKNALDRAAPETKQEATF